jgi:hypothetical protein
VPEQNRVQERCWDDEWVSILFVYSKFRRERVVCIIFAQSSVGVGSRARACPFPFAVFCFVGLTVSIVVRKDDARDDDAQDGMHAMCYDEHAHNSTCS